MSSSTKTPRKSSTSKAPRKDYSIMLERLKALVIHGETLEECAERIGLTKPQLRRIRKRGEQGFRRESCFRLVDSLTPSAFMWFLLGVSGPSPRTSEPPFDNPIQAVARGLRVVK